MPEIWEAAAWSGPGFIFDHGVYVGLSDLPVSQGWAGFDDLEVKEKSSG